MATKEKKAAKEPQKRIDTKKLFEAANNAETLKRILSAAYSIPSDNWRQSGGKHKVRGKSGLTVYKKGNQYFVKDFSSATLGTDKAFIPFGLVKYAFRLEGRAAFEKLSTYTSETLQYTESRTDGRSDTATQPQKHHDTDIFVQPNTGEYKYYFDDVQYCDFSSDYGQTVLNYVVGKTGANEAFLKSIIKPITSTTQYGKTETYDVEKIAYAVTDGLQAKIFRPYLKPQGVDKLPLRIAQHGGEQNYLFGYDALPESCTNIFLLGGEQDTIAFNFAFNSIGWYAVTKGGEGNNYSKSLIAHLHSRCTTLYCLLDNDTTGHKNMEKHAQEHNVQGIDLATYVNKGGILTHPHLYGYDAATGRNKTLNDVCDIIKHLGADDLKRAIKTEIRDKKTLITLPYRETFASVWKTEINQYLGDTPAEYERIKRQITISKKLSLESITGTGKTTLFLKRIANDKEFLAQAGIRRIVYIVPTNSIGAQQAEEHTIPFLTSLYYDNIDAIGLSTVSAVTFNQVGKIPSDRYQDTLFVVDEVHTLTGEFGYRATAMHAVLELMQNVKYCVGLSATPNTELLKHLNLAYCQATYKDAAQAQNINIKPILITKGSAKDVLSDITGRRNAEKVSVVILDSIKTLRAYERKLARLYGKASVTLISSSKDEFCKENENYKSLEQTGTVGEKIKFVLTTKFLQIGVNFEFESEIFIIHCADTASLLQAAARPRINRTTGANSAVNCFVYVSATAHKKDAVQAILANYAHYTKTGNYTIPSEAHNHKSNIKHAMDAAQATALHFNTYEKSKDAQDAKDAKGGNGFNVYFCERSHTWKADVLGIFHRAEQNLQTVLRKDVTAWFAEIKQLNDNVNLLPLCLLRVGKDMEVRTAAAEIKAEQEAVQEAVAHDITGAAKTDILTVAYSEAKNKEAKETIVQVLGRKPTKAEQEAAQAAVKHDRSEVLEVAQMYAEISEAAKNVMYANRTRPIKQTDIDANFTAILDNFDTVKGRLLRLSERLTAGSPITRETAAAQYNAKLSEYIVTAVHSHSHRDRVFSKKNMMKIYNEAQAAVYAELGTKRPPQVKSFEQVNRRFVELFYIDRESVTYKSNRKDEAITFNGYKIGKEITVKNVLPELPEPPQSCTENVSAVSNLC